MMHNVEDLKSRALVESNILKQFILSANTAAARGFKPRLDDILLHDYQMANSVTLNVILSNYVVDLAYAVDCLQNSDSSSDSYFSIVRNLDANTQIPDDTRLLLSLSEDDGTFLEREIAYSLHELEDNKDYIRFQNLDSVWYGVVHAPEDSYYGITAVEKMNDNATNPFGCDPFSDRPVWKGEREYVCFNEFLQSLGDGGVLNSIVENRFHMQSFINVEESSFAMDLYFSRYLVCLPSGFYGLKPVWKSGKVFAGFEIVDIGADLPNIGPGKEVGYDFCSFVALEGVGVTLFLAVADGSNRRYFYLNEDSFDPDYGLTEIESAVVGSLVTTPSNVFGRVDSTRELDNVTIVLTDYGFWDIERNQTDYITYSYSGRKIYKSPAGEYNDDKTKLVTPTMAIPDGARYCEYCDNGDVYAQNRLWALDGVWYKCDELGGKKYRSSILVDEKSLPFFGGTQNFAVYDKGEGDAVHLLVNLDLEQFRRLLFSDSEMAMYFTRWLYWQVTHKPPEGGTTRGEWYLYNNHRAFNESLYPILDNKTFDNVNHTIGSELVDDRFVSMQGFVQSIGPADTLYDYCSTLNSFITGGNPGLDWLVTSVDGLKQNMAGGFNAVYQETRRDSFLQELVDYLVSNSNYELLKYFEPYLKAHFSAEYGSVTDLGADGIGLTSPEARSCIDASISNAKSYIESKVRTALVLGGYKESEPEDNSRYPGIENYIQQDRMVLQKSDVQSILSLSNAKDQMVQTVQSCSIFKNYATYGELNQHKGDEDLFDVTQNANYAHLSNCANAVGRINVQWSDLKAELFSTWNDDERLLKNFMRSQVYRPLFFSPANYFSDDGQHAFTIDKNAYWCRTSKWYVDDNGERHPLVFSTGTTVDKVGSEMGDDISDVEYYPITNKLQYTINYDDIQIAHGKFMFEDVEFYVVSDDGTPRSVYYNEFDKSVFSADGEVPVDNDEFTLGGSKYKIYGDKVLWAASWQPNGEGVDDFDFKYICDIHDEQFVLDGLWCVLSEGRTKVEYAKIDDSRLQELFLDADRRCQLKSRNVSLEISADGTTAYLAKTHQSDVEDRFVEEWCAFDDKKLTFDDDDHTWDYYIANHLVWMMDTYGMPVESSIRLLGNGNLYDGLLYTTCDVDAYHEASGGKVVTKCQLTFHENGRDVTRQIGTIFDESMNESYGKFTTGTMSSSGIIEHTLGGHTKFIFKQPGSGRNNCNAVWMDVQAWEGAYEVQTGVCTLQGSENSEIDGTWNNQLDSDLPSMLQLTPVERDMSGKPTSYSVKVAEDYPVYEYGVVVSSNGRRFVHFLAPGQATGTIRRYAVDLDNLEVSKMQFNTIHDAHTMDFSTHYSSESLKDSLVDVVRQYMLSAIVQKMMDNEDDTSIVLNPGALELDLLPDQIAMQNYILVWGDQSDKAKFAQIYKNHVQELDQESMSSGRVYTSLQNAVADTFHNDSAIAISDGPSIKVKRVQQVSGSYEHQFSYDVVFDVYLFQNKTLMTTLLQQDEQYEDKFMLADAVIRNVECTATFTPVFTTGDNAQMTYDAVYATKSGNYTVEYSKIVYCHAGDVQIKQLDENRSLFFSLNPIRISIGGQDLSQIKDEAVLAKIEGLFSGENSPARLLQAMNNQLFRDGPNRQEVIDVDTKYNVKNIDGRWVDDVVWSLDEDLPEASDLPEHSKLVGYSNGSTVIDGDTFDICDIDASAGTAKLRQRGGSLEYSIVRKQVYTKEQKFVVAYTGDDSVSIACYVADSGTTAFKNRAKVFNAQEDAQSFIDSKPESDRKFYAIQTTYSYGSELNTEDVWVLEHGEMVFPSGYLSKFTKVADIQYPNIDYALAYPKAVCLTYRISSSEVISGVDITFNNITQEQPNAIVSTKAYQEKLENQGLGCFDYSKTITLMDVDVHSKQDDVVLGDGLVEDAMFSVSVSELLDSENPEHKHTFVLSGLINDEEDENATSNDWLGVEGSLVVRFSGLEEGQTPEATLETTFPCMALDGIPDARIEKYTVDYTQYTPFELVNVAEEGQPQVYVIIDDDIAYIKVNCHRQRRKLAIRPSDGRGYIDNGLYVTSSGIQRAVELSDFKNSTIGDLAGNWGVVPKNIGESEYPEQLVDSESVTFAFSGNTPTSARYIPCTARIMRPSQSQEMVGDITGRQYEVQSDVFADIVNISDTSDGDFWVDKTSTAKSTRAIETNAAWRSLIGDNSPLTWWMKQKIQQQVYSELSLDKNYFDSILQRLYDFLYKIFKELTIGDMRSDVAELCHFKYDATVHFAKHARDNAKWADKHDGLFGYDRDGELYKSCRDNFDSHLLYQFMSDFVVLNPEVDDISNRDYYHILQNSFRTVDSIVGVRDVRLLAIHQILDFPPTSADAIVDTFYQTPTYGDISNRVRYMNVVKTSVRKPLQDMFVANGYCNLFTKSGGVVQWLKFAATKGNMDALVQNKINANGSDYEYEPQWNTTQYSIVDDGWLFKMLNRDFAGTSTVNDAFAIHCLDDSQDLWYVPQIGAYIYGAASTNGVLDLAYEQYGDRLYVLFNGDNLLYAYDSPAKERNSANCIELKKETASYVLETFNYKQLTDDKLSFRNIFLDYLPVVGSSMADWRISLYGQNGKGTTNVEVWSGRPGYNRADFTSYNNIMFGDSLFDEGQLRFQNISKNKDMYDILDVNEVDGCYYGLFKDDAATEQADRPIYAVFKTMPNMGIVQKLPWRVLEPHMYHTADDLYSLYVVSGENGDDHPVLREISVPDSDEYPERVLDVYSLFKEQDGADVDDYTLNITNLIMQDFSPKASSTSFYVVSDKGFHRVVYENKFVQLSIDRLDGRDSDGNPTGFRDMLWDEFEDVVLKKHIDEMHDGDQQSYFRILSRKVNQFEDDFSAFTLVPTEFSATQDVGVVPDSKIDDTDEGTDHRPDSVLATTDILWTDGLLAGSDTNPGIVTCAVSNPATIYDDATVFMKSQRNPSIEGTEFYDYIYDQDGNVLMDLYAIPFVYRINSNNTYDLYINVPTTRTKYLNRVVGTLKDNGTSQVLANDTRTRVNFGDEMLSNNLDESITRLRVYIDKKFISIGNVELVEISGNSIPTQIYRDVPNNGLYDSIALESRWNGEIVQIDEPSKDINKVMLEFECYGTDSQSIHIQGKTLVHQALDDAKYKFG